MAEKVRLFEAEIKLDDAIAETQKLKAEVDALREKTANLKKEEGETSKAYIEANAKLKAKTNELRQNERITQQVIIANKANEGSIEQLKAQLALTTAQWNRLSKEERENTEAGKALSKQKLDLTNKLKGEEKATGDTRRNVGNYSEAINEATGALTGMIPAAGQASSAAKMLGAAFKVMLGPVGLIIAAVYAVYKALEAFFTSSEEGQNVLNKLKAVFNAVFGNIMDILSGFGKTIVEVFENPKQAIADLWEAIKTNLINRVKGLIDMFGALGKVLKGVFTLDWDTIKEGAAEVGESFVQTLTGVDNLAQKVANGFKAIGDEMARDIALAKQLADRQAALDVIMRNQLVEEAKLRARIEELKLKAADKDNLSNIQRIAALDEAIELENRILKANEAIATEKLRIKQQQNSLSNSTKEDLQEEAELQAALFNVQRENFAKRKELETQRLEAVRAARAEEEAIEKEFLAMLDEDIKASTDEISKFITDSAAAVAQKQKELDAERAKALDEAIQNEYDKRLLNYETQQALAEENLFTQLDFERQALELKRQQEIEFAEKIGADVSAINEKYDRAEIELERAKQQAKLELAADFFGNIATIFGEQTSIGKAAAIAETTINTYRAATGAYASMAKISPVLGIAAAGAAVAAGLANVKKITAVKSGLPGEKNIGGSGVSAASAPQSVSASIGQGIVARSNEANATNQLNALNSNLANQSAQPVLVVDSVTAAQRTQSNTDVINSI